MTEHSEIRQSIDYLVARIARDYQKEEYKDCLKIQIPFGRRAEILLAEDYLTADEKIIFEDGIDPAIKSELFKEVLQAKTDKVFKSFLLEIFGSSRFLMKIYPSQPLNRATSNTSSSIFKEPCHIKLSIYAEAL